MSGGIEPIPLGVTFPCPNCGVMFGVSPRIAALDLTSTTVRVTFEQTEFEHRCNRL